LAALLHTRRVEAAPNDVIPNTGQVLHTTTPDKHYGMLLKVMALATDVAGNLRSIR
jgi:hypothetical protein